MTKQLYMIGNAHLDPVWLWRWQEGFQEAKATWRSALDRMNEYDDFIFTSSTAALYEWIEYHDPGMFEEIRRRVAEGRWVLCGGWWVQSDCNLPSGESFARQALIGQRYYQHKFGVMSTVGYNVDSFGHHGMLPQLLKKSGMDYYVFMRPGEYEKHLESNLFHWKSDDGSSVLTCRIPYYLNPVVDVEPFTRDYAEKIDYSLSSEQMLFFGVGNHGGGPTKANIEMIRKLNKEGEAGAEYKYVMSSPDRFFERIEGYDLPVLHDDLQMHAKGCYSVHSAVKRWNRRAEQLLIAAEKFAVIAQRRTDRPGPYHMEQAWKNVLFNQFHDILPGSSIESAYEIDARDAYGEAGSIAGRVLNDALQTISWNIGIEQEEGTKPIVVFNPHAWATKVNVELEFGHFGAGREFHSFTESDILVDEEGKQVDVQQVTSQSTTMYRQRLSFTAELPPLGYRTFRVVPGTYLTGKGAAPADFAASDRKPRVAASDTVLENDSLRLEIDPATGGIARLYDKRKGFDVFRGSAAQAIVIEDASDTWSHEVERFDQEIGTFRGERSLLLEHGPVKSVIRSISAYGKSQLIQDFTMYPELDHVEVNVTLDWQEQFKMLKLAFPVNVEADKMSYEIPFGTIERGNDGVEQPGLSWIDQSGQAAGADFTYGLSILNDGKYSFSSDGPVMKMVAVRSPIYAYDRGPKIKEHFHYTFMDQGIQRFSYVLLPHEGDWKQAGTVKRAAELNQPPITVIETYHDGPLPQRDSYIEVDSKGVVVSALKHAEDGDGIILRCYETHKERTQATIKLPKLNRVISAEFGPCEIKTFRIPLNASEPVVETDLLERPI